MSEASSMPAVSDLPQPSTYAQGVFDFLAEEGFRPRLDEEGDVFFKFEGYTHMVMTSHGDAKTFCLMLPYFWPLEDAAERTRALEAAMYVQKRHWIGRVMVLENEVSASVNAFLPDEQSFRAVLLRSLQGLQSLVGDFRQQMRAQLEN